MLVHLNGETWSRGSESDAFAREVCQAMRTGVHRLLVHEVPGARLDDEWRCGCSFDQLIDATPEHLLEAGLYNEIAMNLAGGEWRTAGLAMIVRTICNFSGGSRERWKVESKEPEGIVEESMAHQSRASALPPGGTRQPSHLSSLAESGCSGLRRASCAASAVGRASAQGVRRASCTTVAVGEASAQGLRRASCGAIELMSSGIAEIQQQHLAGQIRRALPAANRGGSRRPSRSSSGAEILPRSPSRRCNGNSELSVDDQGRLTKESTRPTNGQRRRRSCFDDASEAAKTRPRRARTGAATAGSVSERNSHHLPLPAHLSVPLPDAQGRRRACCVDTSNAAETRPPRGVLQGPDAAGSALGSGDARSSSSPPRPSHDASSPWATGVPRLRTNTPGRTSVILI